MFRSLYPGGYAQSVFSIDYQKLYNKGYRGIIFDVDNTLVHHNDDSTPRVDELFRKIHEIGFKTVLVSNNSPSRLERFVKNIDSPYIADADKPNPNCYRLALNTLEIPKQQVVCLGDQMLIDIYGANKFGLGSIFVHYVRTPKKQKVGISRYLEKVVLLFFRFRRSYHRFDDVITKEELF